MQLLIEIKHLPPYTAHCLNNMKKILLTNIYGKHNLGDFAIFDVSMSVIQHVFPNAHYTLLFVEEIPELKQRRSNLIETGIVPYGYAIRSHSGRLGAVKKIIRFVSVLLGTLWQVLLGSVVPNAQATSGFYRYIRQIREADIVISAGGGYLITRHVFGDFFGIILNVVPIIVAKLYRKPIAFLPISFGTFASVLQEKIALLAVRDTTVFSREGISTARLMKHGIDSIEVPDLVLLDWPSYRPVKRKKYFVLTFLDYLDANKRNPEEEIAKVVRVIWEEYQLECVFIPMASNTIEDNDVLVADKIFRLLGKDIPFRVERPATPTQAKDIMRYAQFAICNRMHSAIFATTVFTPFVTISYAHKTIGVMRMLGLSDWNVPMHEIDAAKILQKVAALSQKSSYNHFIATLQEKRPQIIKQRDLLQQKLREMI